MFFKEDNRPEWEKMSDDSMNKFLKFCITCVFLWMGYQVTIALIPIRETMKIHLAGWLCWE